MCAFTFTGGDRFCNSVITHLELQQRWAVIEQQIAIPPACHWRARWSLGISLHTSELLGRKQAIVVLVLKRRCLDYARGTTAEIADMSAAAHTIALHVTQPAAGQPADKGPHSLEPSANSGRSAREGQRTWPLLLRWLRTLKHKSNFCCTHTCARLVSDSVPLQVWLSKWLKAIFIECCISLARQYGIMLSLHYGEWAKNVIVMATKHSGNRRRHLGGH